MGFKMHLPSAVRRYSVCDFRRTTLVVRDSGRGIATEHLPRIFERFYRSRSDSGRAEQIAGGSEPPIQGSGLGLSIARRITANHGGTCEVESEIGKGTLFRVTLPAMSL